MRLRRFLMTEPTDYLSQTMLGAGPDERRPREGPEEPVYAATAAAGRDPNSLLPGRTGQ